MSIKHRCDSIAEIRNREALQTKFADTDKVDFWGGMIHIYLDEFPVCTGTTIKFRSPCDCSEASNIFIRCSNGEFLCTMRDSHGNDLDGIGNVFSTGAMVEIVLNDVTEGSGCAYVLNADTNKYLEDRIANAKNVVFGSYVGTGEGGKNNPNTLTFPFVPRFVFVFEHVESEWGKQAIVLVNPSNVIGVVNVDTFGVFADLEATWAGNTVSWYCEASGEPLTGTQKNVAGWTYHYIAICGEVIE